MPLQITGQPPSRKIREQLAGQTVLLSFSRGKDSIAAWIACKEAGIKVVPFHFETVPGLKFVKESLQYFEDIFHTKIMSIPHPSFYRQLTNYVFQPPERYEVIEALGWKVPSQPGVAIRNLEAQIRTHFNLPASTWVVDGNRASDTMARRTAITRYGYLRSTGKASLIGDWRKSEVYAVIDRAGIDLPIDYQIWGRSFDGLGYHYLAPLRDHLPDDYQRVLDWFPLAELEIFRNEQL